MPSLLTTILPALIALSGTVTIAVIGYRQWKRQQETTRYGNFLSERQQAYKELWERVEAVHLYVRSQEFSKPAFSQLVRAANSHMISAGLHLRDGEKERVNRYFDALEALGLCLADAKASDARDEAQETLYATGVLPHDVLVAVQGLQSAYARVEAERTSLISDFRDVLGARFFS